MRQAYKHKVIPINNIRLLKRLHLIAVERMLFFECLTAVSIAGALVLAGILLVASHGS